MSTAASASPLQRQPELLGQTVVVIGGSAGIGLETARRARTEGAKLILTGRDPDRRSADPRGETPHRADATVTAASCPVIAPFRPERRLQSGPTSRPWEGRTSGL